MSKSRLEAFSDGVIVILITILVLELRVPAGSDLAALAEVLPTVGLYVLSFAFLGIYSTGQPPSPAPRDHPHQRRGAVGKPASPVLVVSGPIRTRWICR